MKPDTFDEAEEKIERRFGARNYADYATELSEQEMWPEHLERRNRRVNIITVCNQAALLLAAGECTCGLDQDVVAQIAGQIFPEAK